ncbi:ABC transporter ATP-binding protein [Dactylosporangium sp. CA-233914]|uniref:ABC transporter ATP-binding protein n=1 Tax=Dactylosporangium sp. CA-233914 TaxID=3239934 RepID=UPI003D91718D
MIELKDVRRTYLRGTPQQTVALDRVSLDVPAGQWVTVVGSNGAGKSTLLRLVAGIEQPDVGEILIDGRVVTRQAEYRRAHLVGRLDQDPLASTAPGLSIEQNLAIAMMRGRRRGLGLSVTKARRKVIAAALEPLGMGLEQRLSAPVGTLSGGQRQAMAMIMATIAQPRALLLDEHIAALDPRAAELVMSITQRLVSAHHLTTLMVTHNMQFALRYGDRLIVMHRGHIVVDLSGTAKTEMDVPALVELFHRVTGDDVVTDRILLA